MIGLDGMQMLTDVDSHAHMPVHVVLAPVAAHVRWGQPRSGSWPMIIGQLSCR